VARREQRGDAVGAEKTHYPFQVQTSEETVDHQVKNERTSVRYNFSGPAGLNPNIIIWFACGILAHCICVG
jgi:hypothetical protein